MKAVIKAYIALKTLSTVKCLLQHIGFRPHIFMTDNYINYNRKQFKIQSTIYYSYSLYFHNVYIIPKCHDYYGC